VDVSFISVAQIAGALARVVSLDADMVVLVKPQFEATKSEADRGAGVIVDASVHERVVGEVVRAFGAVGLQSLGVIESPIKGASGNTEFLAHFRMTP
jgi:23S rRNA (cytidine1920-2'-O)/16S rRNA (cytidine1409-2'-O)-methyltransferase